MKNFNVLNKIFLLATLLLSSYQVIVGGHGIHQITIWSYTTGFGVLVISSIIILILGFETFDKPLVVILFSLIPLSFANGLVSQLSTNLTPWYLIFTVIGFLIIIFTRFFKNKFLANVLLAIIHAIAGFTILLLPIYLVVTQRYSSTLFFFSVGGVIMGLGGILFFYQNEEFFLGGNTKLKFLPGLLLLSTICFTIGLGAF
ncbi:MAG TPA: hypothetical protein VK856_01960 [Anaerolineaceae bacterium]|nr:hypothetical protein [Anaerolineaceae bacterium]